MYRSGLRIAQLLLLIPRRHSMQQGVQVALLFIAVIVDAVLLRQPVAEPSGVLR